MAEAGSVANSNSAPVTSSNGGPEDGITENEIRDGVQLSDLPPNVLRMIFTRLDLPSKKKVVLVCKKWRDVAYDKIVWKNIFVNVDLETVTNRQVFVSFESRGIKRIEVNNLSEPARKLRIMLRSMPSLREFKILGYYNVSDENLNLLHKFPNLRTLDLNYAYKITDETLKVVGRSLRELTTLSLWGCHLITDAGINHLTGTDGKDNIRGSLKIKHLNLQSCTELTDESMRMIATKLLELTKLELQGCSRIMDTGVIFLAGGTRLDDVPGNRKLEELDLSDIGSISDRSLQRMASGMPVLSTLNMSGNRTMTELYFTHLANMTCLKTLKMTYCSVMSEWLVHLARSKIRVLGLASNDNINAEGIRHISGMSYLQELDLTCCGVDDEGLELLSQCPSQITSLDLSNNSKITDASMIHLAKMAHLKILDLSMCQNLTSAGFLKLSELVPPTLTLKCMQNFQRTLECFNQIVRNVEENNMGSEEWLKAIRKMSEIEKLLELELQQVE